MDGVVDVITGRERCRRWITPFKLRVVAETQEPGAHVRAVAARHGVCESLVSTWRRQVREGVLTEPELPVFLPVQVFEAPLSTAVPSRPELPVGHRQLGSGSACWDELGRVAECNNDATRPPAPGATDRDW